MRHGHGDDGCYCTVLYGGAFLFWGVCNFGELGDGQGVEDRSNKYYSTTAFLVKLSDAYGYKL